LDEAHAIAKEIIDNGIGVNKNEDLKMSAEVLRELGNEV